MILTPNQALERLMSTGMRRAKGEPPCLLNRMKTYKQDRLFIFGRGASAIVTPADDTIQPIIAEFDHESGIINPSAQLMLNDYAREVKVIQDGGFEESLVTPTAEPVDYIAPLMPEIMWHQHRPFNDNLDFVEVYPTKGLVERCLVGCTSTAVAQLVYYLAKRGWKRGCVATPPYTSDIIHGCQFEVTPEDARTSFDFANMLDNYTKRKGSQYVNVVSYTEEQGKAAADLCAHVGKAMQNKYSPAGSGQIEKYIADAMENKLHLGHVTIYKQGAKADASSTKYLDKVRESLTKGLPVVICGYTGTTSAASGHCFLAEGYRPTDDTYYINWGWGQGYNNGWFKMDNLKYSSKASDSFKYSFAKSFLILDARPSWNMDVNRDGYINMSDVTEVINAANSGAYVPNADVNYDGKVDIKDPQAITNKILGKNQ